MTYLVTQRVSGQLEPGQASGHSGPEPVPPHPGCAECWGWVLSVHTAMLAQQGPGHSCRWGHPACTPGWAREEARSGGCERSRFGDRVLGSELGGWVSGRLLLLMALPCPWGWLSPALLLGRPASGPRGEATLLLTPWGHLAVGKPRSERPSRLMSWPGFSPLGSHSLFIYLLFLSHIY